MANEKNLNLLEKKIRLKMHLIKNGKVTPKESEIGSAISLMKKLDEPLYDELLTEYKEILENRKKSS